MNVPSPDIGLSALIVVDMQNDFLHPQGAFGQLARALPERRIDMAFLASTIPNARKLIDAFRGAGRPVVYIAHVLKADYSDAAFPYWRGTAMKAASFLVEGSWGASVVDELAPRKEEHLVIKKGFGGFGHTPLDVILRNLGVTTCVVCGVTTCVCVSTTVRGGVEHNYRQIVVSDAVAEVSREQHEAELKTVARVFGDVKTTDEVVAMLGRLDPQARTTGGSLAVLG
jgi:ureidoacrylate peracid hydrolase